MKKTKLIGLLTLLLSLGVAGCGESGAPKYESDKNYHWTLTEDGEVDKETKAKHDFGEPIVVTAATCTAKGKSTKTCKVCGYVAEEEIKMADHVMVDVPAEAVAATCSTEGKTVKKCQNCEHKETVAVPTSAHNLVGTPKTIGGIDAIEYECSVCHEKYPSIVAFNTITVDGDTATSGKLPGTAGVYGTWNVTLPAGEYEVWFTAKFSSSGNNYAFSGSNSRGISVKYNDAEVEFDGTKTAEDYGLTTTENHEFTFFNITATGGSDVLALTNPYYRLVFDVNSYIVFKPVTK